MTRIGTFDKIKDGTVRSTDGDEPINIWENEDGIRVLITHYFKGIAYDGKGGYLRQHWRYEVNVEGQSQLDTIEADFEKEFDQVEDARRLACTVMREIQDGITEVPKIKPD